MKIIRIKDYYGKYQEVPVDDALYDEWIKLENENQRIYRKEVYHRSGVPLEQADSMGEIGQMEDLLERLIRRERNERLYDAISRLTPTQQRRVMMFMDDMSYVEIARREGTKFAPVYRSLQAAFRKLRDLMAEYEDEVRRGIVE